MSAEAPTRQEVLAIVAEGDHMLRTAKMMAEKYADNARGILGGIRRKDQA